MKIPKVSRRSVLRGIGGAALSLPVLELMSHTGGPARAGEPLLPKRYLVCVAGSSLGSGSVDIDDTYVPSRTGFGYDLKPALVPFAGGTLPSGATYADVSSEISVITEMRIPWAAMNGGTVPSGGRPDSHHETMVSPLLAGVRNVDDDDPNESRCFGPTSDQVVADAIGGDTRFHSLQYGVQVSSYLPGGGTGPRGIISYRDAGGIGVLGERLRSQVSPKAAYDALFYNFSTGMEDPAALAARDFERRTRSSILDVVRLQSERLERRIGREDRLRLERHFTEIRELERLIDTLGPEAAGACELLDDPGEDPSYGSNQVTDPSGEGFIYDRNNGYSNEDLRAEIFNRLIHMAFVCDLTRSTSIMYTHFHSWMNTYSLIGREADVHELGHSSHGSEGQAEILAWHYKHFASLVDRLRSTPEGEGGTVLDNCALVMTHEGGYGLDPSDGSERRSHSTERMACLIAGRAGGLVQGQHIRTDNAHPAQVLVSAMRAVGLEGDQLGEVSGVIPELFTGP